MPNSPIICNSAGSHIRAGRLSLRAGRYSAAGLRGWVILLTGLALTATAAAQNVGGDTAARLPRSNEAALLLNDLERAIDGGDHRLVVRLAERFFEMPPFLVATRGSRVFYPASEQVNRLLAELPEDGVQLYRQLNDPAVAVAFEEAVAQHDISALRDLFRRHFVSRHWVAIGDALAAHLVAVGNFEEVLRVSRTLLEAENRLDQPQRWLAELRQAVALAHIGAASAAEERFLRLASEIETAGDPQWTTRVALVGSWLNEHAGRDGAGPSPAVAPLLNPRIAWEQSFGSDLPGQLESTQRVAELTIAERMWPLHKAALAGETLVIRQRGNLWAFSARTLVPRWRLETPASPLSEAMSSAAFREAAFEASPELAGLFSDALGHTLATTGSLCFTIERDETVAPRRRRQRPLFGRFGGGGPVFQNRLVARRADTGAVLWQRGGPLTADLPDTAFLSEPIILGPWLFVLAERDDELRLLGLDAESGDLASEFVVLTGPTAPSPLGGEYHLLADAASIYAVTADGLVAAFDRAALVSHCQKNRTDPQLPRLSTRSVGWRWAHTYPADRAPRRRAMGLRTESAGPAPVLLGDLIIVSPTDTSAVFALNRLDGTLQWERPQEPGAQLIGGVGEVVLFAGPRVSALSRRDGRQLLWRSVPLRLTGRPTVVGSRLLAPTFSGVVELDARTGKIMRDQYPARQEGRQPFHTSMNLFATRDSLYGISPRSVVKYPDRAPRAGADTPSNVFANAMTVAMHGDFEQALRRLDDIQSAAPEELRDAARSRIVDIRLAAATETNDSNEKLTQLEQALAVAATPTDRARTTLRFVEHLLQARALTRAWELAQGLFLSADEIYVSSPTESTRSVAWLSAQHALEAILATAAPEDTARLKQKLLTAAETADLERQLRVLDLVPPSPDADQLAADLLVAVMEGRPAPPALRYAELLARYLPAEAPAEASPAAQLWLALLRWEVAVSVGNLQDAAQFAEAFRTRAAGDEFAAAVSDAMHRRQRRVELAQQKLAAITRPALRPNLMRQWTEAEHILLPFSGDPPASGMVITRNITTPQLSLMNLHTGFPRSNTTSALLNPDLDERFALQQRNMALWGQMQQRGLMQIPSGFTPHTPEVVRHGPLAAVPVRMGVVAYGLGSERLGGQPLWERPIEAWSYTTPRDGLLAVGDAGVFVVAPPNTVQRLDWRNGAVLWSTRVPLEEIAELHVVGRHLVALTGYGRGVAFDARYGDDVQTLVSRDVDIIGSAVIGSTVLLWTADEMQALAGPELREQWRQPARRPEAVLPIIGASAFLSYEDQVDGSAWVYRDLETGAVRVDFEVPSGLVDFAVVDESRLYLVEQERQGPLVDVNLSVFDHASCRPLWSASLRHVAPLNPSLFRGSRRFIPIVLASDPSPRRIDAEALRVTLLNKATGKDPSATGADEKATPGLSLKPFIEDRSDLALLSAFCFEETVIIQVGEQLIAFSSPQAEP